MKENKALKILLIDDEIVTLELTQEGLIKRGFNLTSFCCPVKAIDFYQKNPNHFDFIITDKNMPELSGVELSKKILNTNPHQKIILLTGFFDDEQEEELLNIGIFEIWQKPLSLKEISNRLTSFQNASVKSD